MKKDILLAGLAGMLLVSLAYAIPRGAAYVQSTYRNEGNTGAGFNVSCSSSAWTAIYTARETNRAAVVQNLNTNAFAVCITTFAATDAATCADATEGAELTPGQNITLYDEQTWRCRTRDTTAGTRVKGIVSRDDRDPL